MLACAARPRPLPVTWFEQEGDRILRRRAALAAFYLAYGANAEEVYGSPACKHASNVTLGASVELLGTRGDLIIATLAAAIIWALARTARTPAPLTLMGQVQC